MPDMARGGGSALSLRRLAERQYAAWADSQPTRDQGEASDLLMDPMLSLRSALGVSCASLYARASWHLIYMALGSYCYRQPLPPPS